MMMMMMMSNGKLWFYEYNSKMYGRIGSDKWFSVFSLHLIKIITKKKLLNVPHIDKLYLIIFIFIAISIDHFIYNSIINIFQ